MLFIWIGLWLAGLLLIGTDPKRPATRWGAGILLTGGFGSFSAVLGDEFMPYLQAQPWTSAGWESLIGLLGTVSSRICYFGLPYTYLMFAIRYYPDRLMPRYSRYLPYALLVPPVIALWIEPGQPGDPIAFAEAAIWALPYMACGSLLLVAGALRERNSFIRRGRMMTAVAGVPTLTVTMFTLYVLPAVYGNAEWWRYNVWACGFTLIVFFASSLRYGFLGLQITIKNQKVDYTLRAITSGTAILNHAIKNDVGKIRLFSQKMKAEAARSGNTSLAADIDVIMAASQHIYEMIYRIQGQTQDAEIKPEPYRLDELIREALDALEPQFTGIEVSAELAYDQTFVCDHVQLLEVFTNLITNACEAMPDGGRLAVRLYETKRTIAVELKDTGIGMDRKQLARVFDPFFTTKSGKKSNFGLGLSYCYNVIQKHKGKMAMVSQPGKGTTVFIQFAKKRSLKPWDDGQRGGETWGRE